MVLVWFMRARPRRLWFPRRGRGLAALLVPFPAAAVTAPAADPGVLWQIAVFFGQAGAFVFGSGLAIVPFLYGGVVGTYGWLTDRQFLDAVAVDLTTILIAAATLFALVKLGRRVPEPLLVAAGLLGLAISH